MPVGQAGKQHLLTQEAFCSPWQVGKHLFQTLYCVVDPLLVFCRKVLCEAKNEMQSVFKFSDAFLHLCQTDSPIEASQGSLTFGQPLGQADI